MRVEIKDSESFDQLLRRFQKGIERSGIIREHRRGLRFISRRKRIGPSVARRNAAVDARSLITRAPTSRHRIPSRVHQGRLFACVKPGDSFPV